MVSLSEESRSSGGFFFRQDSSVQSQDSDLLLDRPVFTEELDPPYRQIRTQWLILVQLILFVGLVSAAFLVPYYWHHTGQQVDAFAIIAYCQASLWILLFILNVFIYRRHRHIHRHGYFEFTKATLLTRSASLFIVSATTTFLLILTCVVHGLCSNGTCGEWTKIKILQLFICLEAASCTVCLVVYSYQVIQFDRYLPPPDVVREEIMPGIAPFSRDLPDIGERGTSFVEKLMEKQADMIYSLKHRNENLAKRVLRLTNEIKTYKYGRQGQQPDRI